MSTSPFVQTFYKRARAEILNEIANVEKTIEELSKDFNPELHPRDATGRFGEGGGAETKLMDWQTGGLNEDVPQEATDWQVAHVSAVIDEYGNSLVDDNPLTEEEGQAALTYSANGYQAMNELARDGYVSDATLEEAQVNLGLEPQEIQDQTQTDVDNLRSAIDSSTVDTDVTVFRGVQGGWLSGLQKGDVITDKGFVSTSLRNEVARGFGGGQSGSVVEINIPKGSNALGIAKGEGELLLNSGSRFRVEQEAGVGHAVLTYIGAGNTEKSLEKAEKKPSKPNRFSWTEGDVEITKNTTKSLNHEKSWFIKDWDEAKHPRGTGGRFGSGGDKATTTQVREAVRSSLTNDLRKPKYRNNSNAMAGHCYVASEAAYHMLGGKEAGWTPQQINHEGDSHWYLKNKDGRILDLTSDQFKTSVPYDEGKGKGFLTVEPSERAQTVMDRAQSRIETQAPLAKDWDESKHPRGAGGKFGDGGETSGRGDGGNRDSKPSDRTMPANDSFRMDDAPASVYRLDQEVGEGPEYKEFIAANDSGSGCDDIAKAVEREFDIKQVYGTFETKDGRKEDHSWNVTPEGWIVDGAQYVFGRNGDSGERFNYYPPGSSQFKQGTGWQFKSVEEEARDERGRWTTAGERSAVADEKSGAEGKGAKIEDYMGDVGNQTHITRTVSGGTIPTEVVANMLGKNGEIPGAHRNLKGAEWEVFKQDIKENGIKHPIFITVDHDKPVRLDEGNHRRDAAVALGIKDIPVEIRYFGHAEQQGTVLERAQRQGLAKEWDESKHPRAADGKFGSGNADQSIQNSATAIQSSIERSLGSRPEDFFEDPNDLSGVREYNRQARDASAAAIIEHLPEDAKDRVSKKEAVDVIDSWGVSANDTAQGLVIQDAAQKVFGLTDVAQADRTGKEEDIAYITKNFGGQVEAVLQAAYSATQERLAEVGLQPNDKITVYRGVDIPAVSKAEVGERLDFTQRALSSFTFEPSVAAYFSGSVLQAEVAAKDIVSMPGTGLGFASLAEVVVKPSTDTILTKVDVGAGGIVTKAKGGTINLDHDEASAHWPNRMLAETAATKSWDESKHPRGAGGRFGSGDGETDYHMSHTAPSTDFGAPGHDLGRLFPKDVYSKDGPRLYSTHYPKADKECFDAIHRMRGNPDAEVTVYRGVPSHVTDINPGDWVTPSRSYAEIHVESNVPGGHVISRTVRAGDIYNDADSIAEWGWQPSVKKTTTGGVAKDWDESKHPRGAGGRFGSGDGNGHLNFKTWDDVEKWGEKNGIYVFPFSLRVNAHMTPESMSRVCQRIEEMDKKFPGLKKELGSIGGYEGGNPNTLAVVSKMDAEGAVSSMEISKKIGDAYANPDEFKKTMLETVKPSNEGTPRWTSCFGDHPDDTINHELGHVIQNMMKSQGLVSEPKSSWNTKTNPYVKAASEAGLLTRTSRTGQGPNLSFGSGYVISAYASKSPLELHAEALSLMQRPDILATLTQKQQDTFGTYVESINKLTGQTMVKEQAESATPSIIEDDFGLDDEFWQKFYERVDQKSSVAKYNPNQPRDSHGRFGSGGGGSTESKDEASTTTTGPSVAASWKSINDVTLEGINRLVPGPLYQQDFEAKGDILLGSVLASKGMLDKPTVMSDAEFDKYVKSENAQVLYRGVGGDNAKQATAFRENYLTADVPYMGLGLFGNGTYFSPNTQTAINYSNGQPDQVMTTALKPDAKILEFDSSEDKRIRSDADQLVNSFLDKYESYGKIQAQAPAFSAGAMPSVGVALAGYDAVRVGGVVGGDQLIVLNRGALVVRESTGVPQR